MVNPIRDNQRHGLGFLAAKCQADALMLPKLLRPRCAFRFVRDLVQLVLLIHPGNLHAQTLEHPVKPNLPEAGQTIAMSEMVKELGEISGHDVEVVAMLCGQLLQEHFQPVPGIGHALHAGRVIPYQGALRQRDKAAIAIAALHYTAVNHDRMNLAQLPALMQHDSADGRVNIQFSFQQRILQPLQLQDRAKDKALHIAFPFHALPALLQRLHQILDSENAAEVPQRRHIL